jgi:hypothetical protein
MQRNFTLRRWIRPIRDEIVVWIRHNTSALEKPSFRWGGCVQKTAHHVTGMIAAADRGDREY